MSAVHQAYQARHQAGPRLGGTLLEGMPVDALAAATDDEGYVVEVQVHGEIIAAESRHTLGVAASLRVLGPGHSDHVQVTEPA